MSKILATNFEDGQTKKAFEAMSHFYTSNTASARRNLKGDIERRTLESNRTFLLEFGKVISNLEVMEKEMELMRECCEQVQTRLESANVKTTNLLESADALRSQRTTVETRDAILQAFLARFTLSEGEIRSLTSSEVPIDTTFFTNLQRIHRIHQDCHALLVSDDQQAGLEIMESMAAYQESAFQKLLRWASREVRSYHGDILDVSEAMKLSFKALKQRPVLFRSLLSELATTRQNAITRSFVNALTRGGVGGTPRPIELHAHDSLRYVGDMLAWLHQAVAGERELLEALFDTAPDNRRIGAPRMNLDLESTVLDDGTEQLPSDEEIIRNLMDKSLEGPCRPLKSRVEQVIRHERKAITAFQISNLIQFYQVTMDKTLSPKAALSITMQQILEASSEQFLSTLTEQAARLLRFPQAPASDLSPPTAVKETIQDLKGIMTSYDSSFVAPEERESDFGRILNAVIDPLLQMCEVGAESVDKAEQSVYMLNVLQYIQASIRMFGFTQPRVNTLEGQIESHVATVTAIRYDELLVQSGLKEIIEAMDTKGDMPLSRVPAASQGAITSALSRQFEEFLSSSIDHIMSVSDRRREPTSTTADNSIRSLSHLSDPRTLLRIQQGAAKMFVETYGRLSEAIRDPMNKYEFANTILTRSVEEVEAIMGVV